VSRARNGRTTALLAAECQSFLDNLIAGLGQIGAWNDAGAFPACTRRGSRYLDAEAAAYPEKLEQIDGVFGSTAQ